MSAISTPRCAAPSTNPALPFNHLSADKRSFDSVLCIDRARELVDCSIEYDGRVDVLCDLDGPIPEIKARQFNLYGSLFGQAGVFADDVQMTGRWAASNSMNSATSCLSVVKEASCHALECVRANIGGDLFLHREARDCRITVGGALRGTSDTQLLGGHLHLLCGGGLWSVTASDEGPTEVWLGHAPEAGPQQQQLEAIALSLNEWLARANEKDQGPSAAADVERAQSMLATTTAALKSVKRKRKEEVVLDIWGWVQAGTVIHAGGISERVAYDRTHTRLTSRDGVLGWQPL